MPDLPDLAALREAAKLVRECCPCCNPFIDNDETADVMEGVLALVDTLREYVEANEAWEAGDDETPEAIRFEAARRALGLSVPPAEKKQP